MCCRKIKKVVQKVCKKIPHFSAPIRQSAVYFLKLSQHKKGINLSYLVVARKNLLKY
ncbi:hypothetical protein NT08PM_0450 [Pasteurella multocida subsp. multocida str. 3480]|nr:hypothetical protein NT08PM_0450 [Pasteurella multocida subsp. multocida str. 3480]